MNKLITETKLNDTCLEFRAGFFFSSEVVELEVELKMKLVLKNVVASSDSDLL